MPDTLNEIERRILGVLLEKALAQPAYYPMTLNGIVVAANQKNNRDPVMEIDEEAAWQTLEVLRQKGLVSKLVPGGASRTDKFRHEAQTIFGWEKPQRAIITELLLRGPQTVGELRTRCNRMYAFENLESVTAVLDTLMQRTPPQVALMPRAPGQSAVRYMHLFYPERERPTEAMFPAHTGPMPARPTSATVSLPDDSLAEIRRTIGELENAVAGLAARVEALEQRGE